MLIATWGEGLMAVLAGSRRRELKARDIAVASMVGTAIEWYDFYVYGTSVVLVLGPLWRGLRLAGSTALVPYRYPHQVVAVLQLADDLGARGVHDRVGHQLGHDQGGRVAGVLAQGPAGELVTGHAPGLGHCMRVRGQLEPEPALGDCLGARPGGRPGTDTVTGGVCS